MERSRTEERVDELTAKVDLGFEAVERRFARVEARLDRIDERFLSVDAEFVAVRREMKEGFEAMGPRFDSLHRAILTATIALSGCMVTGFAGLIAAQIWA